MNKITILSLSLLFLTACWGSPESVNIQSDDYFKTLVAESYVTPFKEGDIDLWISVFDEDAIALHAHRTADKGRSSILNFGQAVHSTFILDKYDVVVTDIRRSDQWVYTVGEFTAKFVNRSDGKAPWGENKGKFVLLWEKQKDGDWKIILDMGNTSLQ